MSNADKIHRSKTRNFYEDQIVDGDQDNLARFIDYRVENRCEEELLDYKTEIRIELAEHREDNYM